MNCKHFEGCSAPVCPMDPGSAQAVWFADEPVCRLQDAPEWVKRQRKIAKTGAPATAGCFTLPMLERRCVIGKKMAGIDPIELSVTAAQCLGNRRIPGLLSMNEELAAWHTQRNQSQKGVDWQFEPVIYFV